MQIMRPVILIICLLLYSASGFSQKKQNLQQNNRRIEKAISSGWTFNYFPKETAPKNYETFGFDDSKWPVVSLPHVWRTFETTGELHPYIPNSAEDDNMYWWTGWGWYRKRFALNKEFSGRKVFIEFEGVQKNCKVWLNGKFLGEHKGAYGPFDFDITAIVKPEGAENVLAVAVNNFQEGTIPYFPDTGGGYHEYGGIIRNVSLVLKDQLYIPMQGSASHEGGTFITTPSVNEKEAVVRVQTWVKNDYTIKKNCTLQTTILDGTNKVVQVLISQSSINPGQLFMFDQTFKPLKPPRLWSPSNPYMYTVKSEVIDGKSVVDIFLSPLGIRIVNWDKISRTLTVNGKKTDLKGGNRKQDYSWLGSAVPEWLILADMQFRTEKQGHNFIRTIYNQDSRQVYNQADKKGLIVDAEIIGVNNRNLSGTEAEQAVKEFVRSNRNHPSIIFWSFGNDAAFAAGSKTAIAEDPGRDVIQGRINPDIPVPLFGSEGKGSLSSGEAAKITLTSSHSKITAEKGSVVILSADITDQNGNPVKSDLRNLRWTVSGPAVLTGPVDFEAPGSGKSPNQNEWYNGFPATNIIRSTGMPGKIIVSVFSSGIASGSFEITAEENKPDYSVFKAPLLADEGRKPVAKLIINLNRLDEIKKEIAFTKDPVILALSDRAELKKAVMGFISQNNPAADTSSTEFRALVEILALQLRNNGGRMSSDDFNYNIDHFNNCRLIYSYIMATKLPPLYKETLRKYYARSVIALGSEKNAGDEMNWLNWIPSGGLVVIVQNESTKTGIKGVVYTRKTALEDILSTIYPQFSGFSDEGKERALTFTAKMNPYIDAVESEGKIKYSAHPGEMILIPQYKFISE